MTDHSSSKDCWVKCISTQGSLRGVAIEATDLIQAMATRHSLEGESICRLGEAVMGALLIASYCKQGQKINLNIRGSGHSRQALVDAHPQGTVRGYIVPSDTVFTVDEKTGPWGSGLLSVLRTRDLEGEQPYIGTVPLLTGHLAKDLSFYWVQSEQIPSAVGLAVNLVDGKVSSAGGFLVQAMPGVSPSEVKTIEKHIYEIPSLGEILAEGISPLRILSQIFQSTAFVVVEEKPVVFKCECSWERVQRALRLVGTAELQDMLLKEERVEVRCDFCSKEYEVEKKTIEGMIARIEELKRETGV